MSKRNEFHNYKGLVLFSQVGLSIAIPIFLCLYLGRYIDIRLGTQPLFLIIFIILGVGAGFRNLYVLTMKGEKDDSGRS
jgi:F0F1-type ATP synthase assembly protein I